MSSQFENSGIPTDLIIKLFETLSDSDKATREEIRELTKAVTSFVISNEKGPSLQTVKEEIIDSNDRAICSEAHKTIAFKVEELEKKVNAILLDLIGKVKTMIVVVSVAFSLITLATLIGLVISKLYTAPGVKEVLSN